MDDLLTQTTALLQDDWVIYALPLFFTALVIEWVNRVAKIAGAL
jgi:hypothetical protein